jgi:outer membrane protein assembly factor BamB
MTMHRVSLLIALILGLIVAGPAVAQDPAATPAPVVPADVPTFRANPARTSEQPGPGPAGQPVELWRAEVGVEFRASLAMANGVLYAAGFDGTMHALDPATGAERWAFPTGGQNAKFPTVADGVVFFGSGDRTLYAVDAATGAERWRLPDLGDDPGTLAVDGTLYVSADAGLLALDAATEAERWRYTAGGSAESSTSFSVLAPAYADGVVYAAAGLQLVALNAVDGAVLWRFAVKGGRLNAPLVAGGIVYLANPDAEEGAEAEVSSLYALDAATGAERWRFSVSDDVYGGAVGGGKVYAPAGDGAIYAVDAAGGGLRWRFATGAEDFGVWPVIVGDTVYVAADDGILSAVDAASGALRWSIEIGKPAQSPVVTGGVIYVPLEVGAVIALGDPTAATGGAAPPATEGTPAAGATPGSGVTNPAEYVWQTTGAPAGWATFYVAVAPDGTVWTNDIGQGRFHIFDQDGRYLETWTPEGVRPTSEPFIAFGPAGVIYVTDQFQVHKYDADRSLITAWGGEGTGDGQFRNATGIGVDAAGNVYVCDELRYDVQKFDADGRFLAKWGGPGSGDGQFIAGAGFMDVDPQGNSYVVDRGKTRVQVFAPDGTFLRSFAVEVDGRQRSPQDVAIDEHGNVFVSGYQLGEILVFDATGRFLTRWGELGSDEGQLLSGDTVALDEKGGVYVADNLAGRIVKFRLLPPLAPVP